MRENGDIDQNKALESSMLPGEREMYELRYMIDSEVPTMTSSLQSRTVLRACVGIHH